MPTETEEKMTITLSPEKLMRLKQAKELFESDTRNKIEMVDFIDMLVKTYMTYRDKRGAPESNLLKKLTGR